MTLRQLILTKVIAPLKQGIKVVVDDDNATYNKRHSYISLIHKKAPGRTVASLAFSPLHGHAQLLWSREFSLARSVEESAPESEAAAGGLSDTLDSWIDDAESHDIPRRSEGYETMKEVKLPFQVQANYQFEVPCLLVQWDSVVTGQSTAQPELASGVSNVLRTWTKQNPAGRVILLADPNSLTSGTLLADRDKIMRHVVTSLTSSVTTCVVYVLYEHLATWPDTLRVPLHPGCIAFLQRLFHLHLSHKGSMYVYQSEAHRQMAKNAGMKHIKASRLFSRPDLARSSHACVTVAIPALLRDLHVIPKGEELPGGGPPLPLMSAAHSASPTVTECAAGRGRTLYLAAHCPDVLQMCAELYAEHATPAPSGASRLSLLHQRSAEAPPEVSHDAESTGHQQPPRRRELPSWMKPTDSSKRDLKPRPRVLATKTTYVMTSEELLATARQVLAELDCAEGGEDSITTLPSTVHSANRPQQQPHCDFTDYKHCATEQTVKLKERDSTKPQDQDSVKTKLYKTAASEGRDLAKTKECDDSAKNKLHDLPKTIPEDVSSERISLPKHRNDLVHEDKATAMTAKQGRARHSAILDDLFGEEPRSDIEAAQNLCRRQHDGRRRKAEQGGHLESEGPSHVKQKRVEERKVATIQPMACTKTEAVASFSPIKAECHVTEAQPVELQDNSIIFADGDSDSDSIEISNSPSQDADSILVCDTDSERPPGGQQDQHGRLRLHATRGRHSVTTVKETSRTSLTKERTFSVLDGLF